jgi:hypothetical protein
MAHLSLFSTNPSLSYVIQKNPLNPMMIREMRKGFLYYWFPEKTKLVAQFMDTPEGMSFSEESYEYLDTTALLSPHAYLAILNDLFTSTVKSRHDMDIEGYTSMITLGYIKCKESYLKAFINNYGGDYSHNYLVTSQEMSPGCYTLIFTTKGGKSIQELISLVTLFCMFMAIKDTEVYIGLTDELVTKYIKLANVVKIPYYLANIFNINLLRTGAIFDSKKEELEATVIESVSLGYGNLTDRRHKFIKKSLDSSLSVVDYGCGESRYANFSKDLEEGLYWFPIDEDEECRFKSTRRIAGKRWLNVTEPLSSWEEFVDSDTQVDIQVLLIEMLEHNPIKESKAILKGVLNNEYVKRVVISIPNKDFNKYYLIKDEDSRHDDHDWEMGAVEAKNWLVNLVGDGWDITYHQIGDVITEDEVEYSPTLAYVLIRK